MNTRDEQTFQEFLRHVNVREEPFFTQKITGIFGGFSERGLLKVPTAQLTSGASQHWTLLNAPQRRGVCL